MTDRELDRMMQHVLLDAIKRDCEKETDDVPAFKPTRHYQRQIAAMLSDPLKWAQKRARPLWKNVAQKAAVILLVFSLGLGSLMAVSPTVRAAVVRWVTEWYETHVVYRFSGEQIADEMPQYGVTDLPEGYAETERVEWPSYVSIIYQNVNDENASWIYLQYIYMQQGASSNFGIENADIIPVTVNGLEGQLYLTRDTEGADSTITWIVPDENMLFAVSAALNANDILHIAESVSLSKIEK